MKTITIQTKAFFELIKSKEISMWQLFEQMINKEEEQLIIFVNEDEKEIAHYHLPKTKEQLFLDQKSFADIFKEKLKSSL
ncbi:MAG TPA: hypothetical protein PKX92_02795 [Edaphocola sp.]|nr:hypothetical protein [Edaphocola sp.]